MSRLRTILLHVVAFLALPVLFAVPGLRELATQTSPDPLPPATPELLAAAPRPAFDPSLPTVVVLLGGDLTEVTDLLGPYEMFARAGGLNVVTAAPERRPTLLTGGLGILPHYGLREIDARLGERTPAVVVVPNIPNVSAEENAPLLGWLRQQAAAGALIHSWCDGAELLAHAGLLDGRRATAHWGDLGRLEREYPRVRWVRGVRWVEDGPFVMSAGITSGIDATLRVLTRISGEETAHRVAAELRYRGLHYASDPAAPQYELRGADLVPLANAAFGEMGRPRIGLGLYDGVGELDVSNLYDAHAYTMAADVVAVSEDAPVVRTAHGLALLPAVVARSSRGRSDLLALDRLVVPGVESRTGGASLVAAVHERAPVLRAEHLHADQPDRFGLEPALEDLARTGDVATATLALRRMEYRSGHVRLDGPAAPWGAVAVPVLLGALGLAALRVRRRIPLPAQRAASVPKDAH